MLSIKHWGVSRRTRRYLSVLGILAKPETPKALIIPEILEIILLHLDTRTLLISKRVCYLWSDLITRSKRLQEALFFTPCGKPKLDQEGIINPLIHRMWYQFLRKGLDTRFRFGNNFARLGKIDSTKKEITYLRPEASWRKMLLKQPSTSNVSFTNGVDRNGYTTFTDYHRAKWKPDRDYIRIKNLEFLIDSGTLTPGLYPLYFWANPDAMFETSFKDQIYEKPYINTHLIEYDFAINVHFTDIGFSCWHYNDLISTTPLTTKAWMHSKDVKLYLTNSMKASIFD